jgi:hypothetical protein
MKTIALLHNAFLRTAMALFVILTTTLTASATDFITDVMVAGNSNQSQFNSLIQNLQGQGWTDINYDLNKDCGSGSAYIHLLYKKQSSSGNSGTPITGFYIRTGANPPDNLTYEGRTYYLAPCQGSDSFVSGHGDLNAGCGSGSAYIFLYYTKDVLSNNHGVTGITFNNTQNGAVGENGGSTGYDLNTGCGSNSAYIYMHLTTTSGANVVTLCSGSGNVQLLNGHILTGTGGANTHVTIADGATVTLSGVDITSIANNDSHQWPGISCLGDATITLGESTTNNVKGGYQSSGIHVAEYKTLTLQGNGTLNATGTQYAAGIGSYNLSSCGNITINGGTVNATGGQYAAGIGSGSDNCSCGSISIRGGTVNATGGQYAAGIGSGNNHSDCWYIFIHNTVTRVTATKGTGCDNAIGAGGNGSTCQSIYINGTETGFITQSPFVTFPYTVVFNANGGTGSMNNQSFMYNVTDNLFINNYSRTSYYAFEGWATSPDGPKVYDDGQSVINLTQTPNATVTLYAKWVFVGSIPGEIVLHDGDTLTGIGGAHTHVFIADGATVTFSSVDITTILEDDNHRWPGITCLGDAIIVLAEGTTNSVKGGMNNPGIYVPQGHTLTLQGNGTLNATGGNSSAGIGSGRSSSCGNITISGGNVTAIGGQNAAGIGSGRSSSCGTVTISDGTVTATGSQYAAGIGSGYYYSSCGNITINGGIVNATGGELAAGIGSGRASSCGNITISGGTITATGGYRGAGIGSGWPSSCDNIAISGGTVTATGGQSAAGIGSGCNSSCGNITISGGTVTATGGDNAAGIGSGYWHSSCGDIIITNGVTRVIATAGQDYNNAIGAGDSDSTCGTVTIGGVGTGFITQSPFVTFPYTVAFDANGGTGTMDNQSFMYNVAQHLTANSFTYSGHSFQGWANTAEGPKVYDNEESVSNLADTIANVTLYAKWEALPSITLPIAGYGTDNGGWHLIASPLLDAIDPATVGNMIPDNAARYDLYRFNPSHEGNEWENYKADSVFMLEAGKGYLYANADNVTLTFIGMPYTGNGEVTLIYDSTDERKCWNLVGNPFNSDATLDREYYVMSSNGTGLNPEPIPATTPIPPCTAVFVKAVAAGDKAVFTQVTPTAKVMKE